MYHNPLHSASRVRSFESSELSEKRNSKRESFANFANFGSQVLNGKFQFIKVVPFLILYHFYCIQNPPTPGSLVGKRV